jgi:transposase
MKTIKINYDSIFNYFDRRSTSAAAASINSIIKLSEINF